jgi:small subunit ribosomal protein S17
MKTVTGIVVSNKMTKTVVVEVTRLYTHPMYKKTIKRSRKFKAHAEVMPNVGDEVKLVAIRPVSKDTHYKVSEILRKTKKIV